MTIVAGIDEAGYGPTLGPLVLGASAFRLADGVKERDLDRLVKLRRDQGGLAIRDSKQLYHSGGSIAAIESTTLGHVVLSRGVLPLRLGALLTGAVDHDEAELRRLPWYGQELLDLALPRRAEVTELLERTERQRELLDDRGLSCAGLFLQVIPEPRFTRLTAAAGSKAWTLFYAAGRLIEKLVASFPDEELVIHLDRHGGRLHYADMLQTFFPLAPLTTLHERRAESAYVLDWPGRSKVRIDFKVKADDSRTPVALASVAAKTARELFMERFNAWFAARKPGLAPTAGYPVDARRFLADIDDLSGELPADRRQSLLIRCR